MTEQQRKGIEILNNLKAEKFDDGTPILSDDDYFFLLSFIVDKQNEVQYVPQTVRRYGQQTQSVRSTDNGWR